MAARKASAVLVDMDGTLLDTAPDMASAVNALLVEERREPLRYEQIRPQVSHGSLAVVRLAFPQSEGEEFERLRQRFLQRYRADLARQTRPFAGFDVVFTQLAAHNIPWGIVTNKPAWLSEPLMQELALPYPPGCLLSGDSLPERKPHPRPLLVAAEQLGVPPADCLYLGDARRDIDAARAAGMIALGAAFGYLGENDDPDSWGAEAWLQTPDELLQWVQLNGAERG
ncbi:MAG: HAD-IA family hydrolase [Steroidobacteraceae bacterium]